MEDAAEIQNLTQQIQSLHTLRCPTPPPLNVEELLPKIHARVVRRLDDEMVPVIDHLQKVCSQFNEHIYKEIQKMLQPTLELTDLICRHAREK